jgi:FKBP-type peptidyl-prolyl cis-trans isomerase FkpA
MKKLSILLVTLLIAFAGCKKDGVNYGAIDNTAILAYLQANNLTAKRTGDGLYYIVTTPGDSTRPLLTSTAYVKYRGYVMTGTTKGNQFDSSYELSEQPAQFVMSGLIKGFAEGLRQFGKGGKGTLIIPSTLGYGSTAQGVDGQLSYIPANSVLIFDIELTTFQ